MDICLVIWTAFRFNALSNWLLEVREGVLVAYHANECECGVYRPNDTTRFASTESSATGTSNFLANTGLFRFCACARDFNRCFSRLTRICTFIHSMVGSDFIAVTLVFRVASLRIWIRVLNCLTKPSRYIVFFNFYLLMFFRVCEFYLTMSALSFNVKFSIYLARLRECRSSHRNCYASVISKAYFCDCCVSFFRLRFITILVVPFTNVLRLGFGRFLFLNITKGVDRPIMNIRLLVLSSTTFTARATTSILWFRFVIRGSILVRG